jgi:hypothetical protein
MKATSGMKKNWFRRHPVAVGTMLVGWLIIFLCWLAAYNTPEHKKLDYSRQIYTVQGAIVCPQSLLLDPRADHDANAIFEVFTALSDRDEKARNLGCEVLREGIPVYAHRMSEPFDTYISISMSSDRQDGLFTMEADLENDTETNSP